MTHVFFLFLAIVLRTESFLLDKKLGEQSFYLQQVESEKHLNQKRLKRLLSKQYCSERPSVLLEEESVLMLVEIEWESSKYRSLSRGHSELLEQQTKQGRSSQRIFTFSQQNHVKAAESRAESWHNGTKASTEIKLHSLHFQFLWFWGCFQCGNDFKMSKTALKSGKQ